MKGLSDFVIEQIFEWFWWYKRWSSLVNLLGIIEDVKCQSMISDQSDIFIKNLSGFRIKQNFEWF